MHSLRCRLQPGTHGVLDRLTDGSTRRGHLLLECPDVARLAFGDRLPVRDGRLRLRQRGRSGDGSAKPGVGGGVLASCLGCRWRPPVARASRRTRAAVGDTTTLRVMHASTFSSLRCGSRNAGVLRLVRRSPTRCPSGEPSGIRVVGSTGHADPIQERRSAPGGDVSKGARAEPARPDREAAGLLHPPLSVPPSFV